MGRYLVIGFAGGEIPRLPINQVLLNNRTLVGVDWGAWTGRDPEGNQALLAELMELAGTGALSPGRAHRVPARRRGPRPHRPAGAEGRRQGRPRPELSWGSAGMLTGMTRICEGASSSSPARGRGLGRAHALELARQGARRGRQRPRLRARRHRRRRPDRPARSSTRSAPPAARRSPTATTSPTSTAPAASSAAAVDAFGGLDVVVNNAGFVRDRMFANVAEDEWDAVVRVHLKGHFAVARHAAAHWRDQAKAGAAVDARIINTSSGAGILGSVGQAAYSAAKAGIATLTLVQAAELGRYGVTANALCPAARTRMTEGVFTEMMAEVDDGAFDAMAPENVSPLVAWLASSRVRARHRPCVRGGGRQGRHRHRLPARPDASTRAPAGTPAELTPVVDDLLAKAPAAGARLRHELTLSRRGGTTRAAGSTSSTAQVTRDASGHGDRRAPVPSTIDDTRNATAVMATANSADADDGECGPPRRGGAGGGGPRRRRERRRWCDDGAVSSSDATQRAGEGDVVGDPLGVHERVVLVVHRHGEQEGGDELHAREGRAQPLQQGAELVLDLLVVRRSRRSPPRCSPCAARHNRRGAVCTERGWWVASAGREASERAIGRRVERWRSWPRWVRWPLLAGRGPVRPRRARSSRSSGSRSTCRRIRRSCSRRSWWPRTARSWRCCPRRASGSSSRSTR